MTDVIDDMFDIARKRGNGIATIRSTVLRPSNVTTGAVTPTEHRFDIVNGRLELRDLDPGPAKLHIRMGSWTQKWNLNIPDSPTPITLKTVLENYVEYEPGVVSETRANADRAEASAVRSESAADRAEDSERYVQGVVADGVAAVRAEVSTNADDARDAAAATAADRIATGEDRAATGEDRTAIEAASSDVRSRAEAAAAAQGAAEGARDDAGEHRQAAEAAARAAGEHEAAARQARAGAESAAADAAADAAALVTTALQQAVAEDRQAAEAARAGAESAAGTAATEAAAQVTGSLKQAVSADRQATETARGDAQAAATAAGEHKDEAEGFAEAADASARAADGFRQLAEEAAENAQQGAPAGGWLRSHLSPEVQEDLNRGRTALQSLPDATETARGVMRLAGDLGGTAEAPTVPRLADKAEKVHEHPGTEVMVSFEDVSQVEEPHPVITETLDEFADRMFGGMIALLSWQWQTTTVGNSLRTASTAATAREAIGAYQKPASGIPEADLAETILDALGKAATAVQGSKNGVRTAFTVWVGTEAQYNAETNNGANEAPNTIYLRGA